MARSKRPDVHRVATHAEVTRLRALLREPQARQGEGLFVAEGPRVVGAALDHDAPIATLYVGEGHAVQQYAALIARAEEAGVAIRTLTHKVGDTRAPQPVFALVQLAAVPVEILARSSLSVIVAVNDPGNAGTVVRSAAAAGAEAVAFTAGSVDGHNPKVVRASAGAVFALPVAGGVDSRAALAAARSGGAQCLGAVPRAGSPPESFDLTRPTCFVLGHETRGLEADLALDALVTVPMAGAESLNLAMAATVLLFEAARARRAPGSPG